MTAKTKKKKGQTNKNHILFRYGLITLAFISHGDCFLNRRGG